MAGSDSNLRYYVSLSVSFSGRDCSSVCRVQLQTTPKATPVTLGMMRRPLTAATPLFRVLELRNVREWTVGTYVAALIRSHHATFADYKARFPLPELTARVNGPS